MIGNSKGSPDQLPSSSSPWELLALVSPLTDFEYQAVRGVNIGIVDARALKP
jgi:hypothetical protein